MLLTALSDAPSCAVCSKAIVRGLVTVDLTVGENVIRVRTHLECTTFENCRVTADRWLENNSTR